MNQDRLKALKENIAKHIVGKDELVENVFIALLAGGHVLPVHTGYAARRYHRDDGL